ncbi:hypothetical protein P7K49_016488, partial [Saguinus oedipus]
RQGSPNCAARETLEERRAPRRRGGCGPRDTICSRSDAAARQAGTMLRPPHTPAGARPAAPSCLPRAGRPPSLPA